MSQSEGVVEGTGDELLADEHQYLSGVKLFLVLVPCTLVYFLTMLDSSIIATAVPQITSDFDSLLDIGWYSGAYSLASAAFQPMTGKLFTYFHTKWTYLIFFFTFELGSVLCAAAQSSNMLILGRAVAGLGVAGLNTGAMTIASAIMEPRKLPMAMGIIIALGDISIACGPLIGGAFTEFVSWRWCFYLNLPLGAVLGGILALLKIPEVTAKPPARKVLATAVESLDLPGFFMIAPTSVMFLLALHWGGNEYAWNSAVTIGLFVGAAATLLVFLAWEYRCGDAAMIPFSMLRMRVIWTASVTMFFLFGAIILVNYYQSLYFQAILDESPFMSGVHILPTVFGQIVFSAVSGILVGKLGYYLPWALCGSVFVTTGYGLLSRLTPSSSPSEWAGYQVFNGIGSGLAGTIPYIAIQSTVSPKQISTAMSFMTFCQYMGGTVAQVAAQAIFNNSMKKMTDQYAPGVDAEAMIQAGARSFRQLVSADQLPNVLVAYCKSINSVMYLGVGLGIASFLFSWGMGWRDIRQGKGADKPSVEKAETSALP
ncbi:MFS general substrate transporter [Thozetella sp. PMI_491]|nr:MFS general substrate transporter [Thozetella sp. PMI_491]